MSKKHPRALLRGVAAASAVAGIAMFASPAMADTPTAVVGATVGTSLTLVAGTPGLMAPTYSTPGTSNSIVTVTSTQPSWSLYIADANTGLNAGHMLETTPPATLVLHSPLQWSTASNGTFYDLTGSANTTHPVATGGLGVSTPSVYFQQALDPTDATNGVAAAQAYQLTVNYTAG